MKKIMIIGLILFLSLFEACQSHLARKNLDPESSRFIFTVRYIITAKEYDQFLKLPGSERVKFIEDFWKRRDPVPETEDNEFQEAYMERIDEAKQIFGRGAGSYLTDRGEIYVLFGPPDDVYIRTIDQRRTNKVMETWYYAQLLNMHPNVEIIFIDRNNPGNMGSNFRTGSFSPGSYTLVRRANIISLMEEAKSSYLGTAPKTNRLKLGVRVKELKQYDNSSDLVIRVEIPYQNIWFSKAKEKMEAAFSLKAEVFNRAKEKVWNYEQEYSFSIFEKKVEEFLKVKEKHLVEIPTTLPNGKYSLHLTVTDKKGDLEEKKVISFKL